MLLSEVSIYQTAARPTVLRIHLSISYNVQSYDYVNS